MTSRHACPACGKPLDPGAVVVSVDSGFIAVAWHLWPVHLPRRLCRLAAVLARAMPRTVDHDTLASTVWPDPAFPADNNRIVSAITHLRRPIQALDLEILNVKGVGYRMVVARQNREHEQWHEKHPRTAASKCGTSPPTASIPTR